MRPLPTRVPRVEQRPDTSGVAMLPSRVPVVPNLAWQFNGSNRFEATNVLMDIELAYTASMWLRLESTGTLQYVWSQRGQPTFARDDLSYWGQTTTKNYRFESVRSGANAIGGSQPVPQDVWRHVVMFSRGESQEFGIWEDGVFKNSRFDHQPQDSGGPNGNWCLGDLYGGSAGFVGRIAHFAVWNTVLSGAEIVKLTKAHPLYVRPQSIRVSLEPTMDGLGIRDLVGVTGFAATPVGTPTVVAGPGLQRSVA